MTRGEADDRWRSGHGQAENTADGCPGITREAFQTNYGTVMEKIHVHNEETVVREERFLRQTKCWACTCEPDKEAWMGHSYEKTMRLNTFVCWLPLGFTKRVTALHERAVLRGERPWCLWSWTLFLSECVSSVRKHGRDAGGLTAECQLFLAFQLFFSPAKPEEASPGWCLLCSAQKWLKFFHAWSRNGK